MKLFRKRFTTPRSLALTVCVAVWLLSRAPFVAAVELNTFSTLAEVRHSQALHNSQSVQTELELALNGDWQLNDTFRFLAGARTRIARDQPLGQSAGPNNNQYANYSDASKPRRLNDHGTVELRDFLIEIDTSIGQVRLGKQQIVWGALDGLKVTDILQPQNFREFILEDFGESRISTWSAYADLTLGAWRVEAAWTPDPTAHELPHAQAWFAFKAPRFGPGVTLASSAMGGISDAQQPDSRTNRGGIRISRDIGNTSLSLIAVSHLDFQPLLQATTFQSATGVVPLVTSRYEDARLFGATIERSLGSVIVRGELAARPNRGFNTNAGGTLATLAVEHFDQYVAAIGIDVNAPFDVFVNLQFLYDKVDAPARLIRPSNDKIATLLLRKRFFYDTLTLDLRWYGELNREDGLVRANLDYALGDATTIGIAVDTFYGSREGLFGQFARQDRLQLRLTHTF